MNWLLENEQTITLTVLVVMPMFIFGFGLLISSRHTPEEPDLQGAPETLGDFPPLGRYTEAWSDVGCPVTRIELTNAGNGEFPEGTPVGMISESTYIKYGADGVVETDGKHEYLGIADGKGGYKKEEQ